MGNDGILMKKQGAGGKGQEVKNKNLIFMVSV